MLDKYFSKKEIVTIAKKLHTAAMAIRKKYGTVLITNKPKETWMDSLDRAGVRIEIQAMRLLIYNTLARLTRKKKYKELEKNLKKKVIDAFFNGKHLYDGLDDPTIRPNIFIKMS